MSKQRQTQEKFKTMIGGQALIEGIMMRGPELDAIVTRGKEGLHVETTPRKIRPKNSVATWPIIRGVVNFFDSQIVGVKALMRSADLSPEESVEEPSKFDKWLEKKLGDKKFQNLIVGIAVTLGLCLSVFLFFLVPMLIGEVFSLWVDSIVVRNLLEGVVRIVIFVVYMYLMSRLQDMRRVFAYHGAEHKTIRCYEAGLPLTVENVRAQTRMHPRCGTSFLLVVMVLSILLFSVASSALLAIYPDMPEDLGGWFRVVMILYKLLLLPLVVAFSYEINRWVGKHDNGFTRAITAPGMWFQNFTTNEPDDSMIEVGIAALEAVIPKKEEDALW